MTTVAISGASGYIGRHLVAELLRLGDWRIKVLSRSRQEDLCKKGIGSEVEVVTGDMRNPSALKDLIEPDCTVINLAYLSGAGQKENLAACTALLEACKDASVRRLIHCSTTSVVGRTLEDSVTEETPCRPTIGYGVTKLRIEGAIIEAARGVFDATILRPAAVFGPEGKNLEKLTGDLAAGRRWRNYARSCLFGNRRMNLVAVANVVAAILFLMNRERELGGEIFNISDSDSRLNNFFDVERILIRELGLADSYLPRIALPRFFLKLALKLRGRDGINPQSDFSCEKLLGYGFRRPVDFETALIDYAAWYARNRLDPITLMSD